MATLTSANSVFMLSIAGIYPQPQQIQGYATDDAFALDTVDTAETLLGVDGIMSAGWIPVMTPMNVSLQADSVSVPIFDNWFTAQNTIQEIYFASAVITLPGTGQKYNFTRGVLVSSTQMPGVKKILQPRQFKIHWNTVSPAII